MRTATHAGCFFTALVAPAPLAGLALVARPPPPPLLPRSSGVVLAAVGVRLPPPLALPASCRPLDRERLCVLSALTASMG
jgi:hypothetical protein